jgi:hypothetical protein
MAIDVTTLNSCMDAAVLALAGGDYATALNQSLAAQGILSLIPDLTRASGKDGGSQAAKFDRLAIDSFIKRIRQQQGAALGVQTQDVVYVNPVPDGSQFEAGFWGGTQ